MNFKPMRPILVRTSLLATVIAIASISGGILTACSTASQNQVQAPNTPPASTASSKQDKGQSAGTEHSSDMNHNIAMDLGSADAQYDLRFIDGMTPHHQGAVKMAKEAQQKSQRPEIKKLADDIIKAQNKEINQLKQWRKAWYPQASSTPMMYDAQMGKMMPMSQEQMKNMMMDMNLEAADAEFDLRFINAMIPHHEGAITMAQDALSKSKRPQIKQLAQDIITSQKVEIDQMKQWRQTWYKK
ncbi:DUF305 domain-containing protein [Argonema antarcticum]|uniref:DUF305 domain-containing protein n=1 Tax=Argonema antarcticum TaxID=2942763 RepID=UPI0020116D57|nr:DUF305 domain-containing protein [Argonema antarcticum]MCL1473677.1 DUF305 domain-containing protein [Argonema antarcticum A004/B2]